MPESLSCPSFSLHGVCALPGEVDCSAAALLTAAEHELGCWLGTSGVGTIASVSAWLGSPEEAPLSPAGCGGFVSLEQVGRNLGSR